jgi:hypothetical protein
MAEDTRQQAKVKHLMKDIIAIVFFAEIANATEWIEIYLFGVANEKYLRKYLELPNGIPSHDTIQRVFAMVSPEYLQEFRKRWNEVMSGSMGNKVRKILALDGKTQRGNGTVNQKDNPIVSAVDNNRLPAKLNSPIKIANSRKQIEAKAKAFSSITVSFR